MKVYVVTLRHLSDENEVICVCATLALAIEKADVYEEQESCDVHIGQWEVEQEQVEPQRMMVIYEDWGPKIRMGNN